MAHTLVSEFPRLLSQQQLSNFAWWYVLFCSTRTYQSEFPRLLSQQHLSNFAWWYALFCSTRTYQSELHWPTLTLSLPRLPRHHSKTANKVRNLKSRFFFFFKSVWERLGTKMHSSECRYVIWPENGLFASICIGTFHSGNVTGWGSKGV